MQEKHCRDGGCPRMKKVGQLVLNPEVCQVLSWYRDGAETETETETGTETPSCSQSDAPALQEQYQVKLL